MKLYEEFNTYENLWEEAITEASYAPDVLSRNDIIRGVGRIEDMIDPYEYHGTYYSLGTEVGALAYIRAKTRGRVKKLEADCKKGEWPAENDKTLKWIINEVRTFVLFLNNSGYAFGDKIKETMNAEIKDIRSKATKIEKGLFTTKSEEPNDDSADTENKIPHETIKKHHNSNVKIINILKRYTDLGSKVDLNEILKQLDANRLIDYAHNKYVAYGDERV